MTKTSIYQDIATRTDGSIFLGVVGPVRSGKSTFIKNFMEQLVLPNIETESLRERANDEMPQSSAGRTIMTTEPKFIPERAVELCIDDATRFSVRLIDCVGYIVPSALGYIENEQPRMVKTPWYEEEIPFNMAAEIGTKKVIEEHSTVGIVVTTDGSIGEIPREEYAETEQKVIEELKALSKPFVVLMNCVNPNDKNTIALSKELSEKYEVTVYPINCLEMKESDISAILQQLLYEFPVKQISFNMPEWLRGLSFEHPLKCTMYQNIMQSSGEIKHLREVKNLTKTISQYDAVSNCNIEDINCGNGQVTIRADFYSSVFYSVVSEQTGLNITDDRQLLETITELGEIKKQYMRIKGALDEVEATGYGIVMPTIEELTLEEPEIMREGNRYGVRLKASAPSLHIMKANINTEVSPIVGTERQSEDLVMYLLREFEENPLQIWNSDIFGKSLHELVNEGLHTKLSRMPQDARMRMQETVERVINEGCSGLICIIL